jgi:hypothetical protein
MSSAADRIFWVGRTCELRGPAASTEIVEPAKDGFGSVLIPQPQPAI